MLKTNHRFAVLDFETTGDKAQNGDQIIQVGIVTVDDGVITDSYASLVKPEREIPDFITRLTGITDEMVADAPTIEEVLPEIWKRLDGRILVAHNVHFDLAFLQQALSDQGYLAYQGPVLDTVELARILLPSADGYRLTDLASTLEIEHKRPHQAESDAWTTAVILLQLLDRLNKLPLITIQKLKELSHIFKTDLYELLSDFEQIKWQNQDGSEKEDLETYRHIAIKIHEQDEPVRPDDFPSFDEWIDHLFSENGVLARLHPQFERREAQIKMMEKVYHSFQNGQHLLIEAGTGTGKSLGYLIPALYWAQTQDKKVVISTNTIQLQEQLFQRDMPLLNEVWPDHPGVALLKGRNNYLCLRKFEQSLLESASREYENQLQKARMLVWLTETSTGDVEELNLSAKGKQFWKQVQSDASSCLNRHCPWFSRCFYHRARHNSQEADVMITNHSLLLTDMKSDHRILPAYDYAIVDEAHHFEESATHHLGISLNSYQMNADLNQLTGKQGELFLGKLFSSVKEWNETTFNHLASSQEPLQIQAQKTREAVQTLFSLIDQWAKGQPRSDSSGRKVVRYHPLKWEGEMKTAAQNAVDEFIYLGKELEHIASKLMDEDIPFSLRAIVTDLHGFIRDCQQYAESLFELLLDPDDSGVYWLEVEEKKTRGIVYLYKVPVDVSVLLQETFFDQKESVVLTSATISVNQSFDYPLERLGLSELFKQGAVNTSILPSPFNYKDQALFCIPTDIPNIKQVHEEEYLNHLVLSLKQVAEVTSGRMLVLFTSYDMLHRVYHPLKEALKSSGIEVFGHGIDSTSRSILLRKFKSNHQSILLGTSSFWEGVDIPGEALSCLVIVKLPFTPPYHPVAEARTDLLKKQGKNPFMELSVPQAVIKFKQGFGRLVRSRHDKGIVIIFDRRIVEARYGRQFIQSLPESTIVQKPLKKMLPVIQEWLG
ncbi:MAG: ATP-dependent DNA helicase DinG [Bacillaceae bacterium]|nr:ATP-dependent DNA helicase DinG [Bacillaceae bacterium]